MTDITIALSKGRIFEDTAPLLKAAGIVAQDRAFAAAAFGQQHAGVVHAGRVELPELHVLERDSGARGHAQAVAGVDEGVG